MAYKEQNYHSDKTTGWDARQHFTKLLIDLAREVSDCKIADLNSWLEKITDFFDIACSALQKNEYLNFEAYLEWINVLEDDKKKKQHLRWFFREVNRQLFKEGIYMPIYKKTKEGDEILDF